MCWRNESKGNLLSARRSRHFTTSSVGYSWARTAVTAPRGLYMNMIAICKKWLRAASDTLGRGIEPVNRCKANQPSGEKLTTNVSMEELLGNLFMLRQADRWGEWLASSGFVGRSMHCIFLFQSFREPAKDSLTISCSSEAAASYTRTLP